MYIDESLARGLSNEFWRHLQGENASLIQRIKVVANTPAGDLTNTKRQAKYFKELSAIAKCDVVLHEEISGKRKRAVWWTLLLECDPKRQVNSWNERSLMFSIARVWAYPQDWNPTWLTALVGEHCIMRMFQRMPWEQMPSPRDIFPELRELALLVPWYIRAYSAIRKKFDGRLLTIFIATSNGVFLGKVDPSDPELLELRTFVSVNQLTPKQLELWNQLIALTNAPEYMEYLNVILDTTGYQQQAKEGWSDWVIRLIILLTGYAELLQSDINTLHPSLIRATLDT